MTTIRKVKGVSDELLMLFKGGQGIEYLKIEIGFSFLTYLYL